MLLLYKYCIEPAYSGEVPRERSAIDGRKWLLE